MRKLAAAACLAVACIVPAAAPAAKPAKDSSFQYCEKKNSCPFGFNTNKTGKKITDIMLFTKCNGGLAAWPSIKVKKNGKFKKTGTTSNLFEDITFTIKGKFVKKKKAVGTYKVETSECSDKAVEFVAKRVGRAAQG